MFFLYILKEISLLSWSSVNVCINDIQSFFFVFFQTQEWVNRIAHDGRTVVGVSQHKTAAMQIATFALTQEEDAVSYLPAKFHYHLCLEGTYIVCRSIRQVLVPTVAPDVL